MQQVTLELQKAMDDYYDRFGDIVPLEMIPSNETVQGLIEKINKCFQEGKDLLPEIYGWKFDGNRVY